MGRGTADGFAGDETGASLCHGQRPSSFFIVIREKQRAVSGMRRTSPSIADARLTAGRGGYRADITAEPRRCIRGDDERHPSSASVAESGVVGSRCVGTADDFRPRLTPRRTLRPVPADHRARVTRCARGVASTPLPRALCRRRRPEVAHHFVAATTLPRGGDTPARCTRAIRARTGGRRTAARTSSWAGTALTEPG